jgi:hypothetical protein
MIAFVQQKWGEIALEIVVFRRVANGPNGG